MLPQKTDRAVWFVIFILLIFVVGSFVFIQYEISQIKNILNQPNPTPEIVYATILPVPTPSPAASPTQVVSTPTPKTVVVYSSAPKASQITYIPLTGGNTQNTDWTTIDSSSFTLNIGDYGSKAYAIWDTNLRVGNANGTTFVRLFDKTHSIAVNGSEISLTNTSTSTDVASGQLFFWQGNNSYVVQIKSLNSSTSFMDSGKIKITY